MGVNGQLKSKRGKNLVFREILIKEIVQTEVIFETMPKIKSARTIMQISFHLK